MITLNRKGQGTIEYIIILSVIVLIALAVGTGPLGKAITDKVKSVADSIK